MKRGNLTQTVTYLTRKRKVGLEKPSKTDTYVATDVAARGCGYGAGAVQETIEAMNSANTFL
jgi:hypothetical protein